MAGWNTLICLLARASAAVSRWHHARVIKWENRYIDQYQRQIDDAMRGVAEAKLRREKAASKQ